MAELSQTAASVVTTSTDLRSGTSGGSITAGMPIYIDTGDSNKLKACQANTANTANCSGIALTGSSSGQPIRYVAGPCNINLGATLAVGQSYYVSANTAGKIWPVSDLTTNNYVTFLGVATNASNLSLQILNTGTAHA
jgi:hypothetical protein